jgi:hypothetical protein
MSRVILPQMLSSPYWHQRDHSADVWGELQEQPLLLLHNLLEALDRRIVFLLGAHFESPEEAEKVFAASLWSSSAWHEVSDVMHFTRNDLMLENYYHLRAIVARRDHCEVLSLLDEAASKRRAA